MRFAKIWRSKRPAFAGATARQARRLQGPRPVRAPGLQAICIALVALVALAVLVGCAGTVTTPVAQAAAASFDGTNQNSGVIALVTNQAGVATGAIITPHARDRYNALMSEYGRAWLISGNDVGLTCQSNGCWFIDDEHLQDFITASRWRRNGHTNGN